MTLIAKVIDQSHLFYGQVCNVGPQLGETYSISPIGEAWHTSYARPEQLEFGDSTTEPDEDEKEGAKE